MIKKRSNSKGFRCVIVQDRIPKYREFFFDSLIRAGELENFEMHVYRINSSFQDQANESEQKYSGYLKSLRLVILRKKISLTILSRSVLTARYIVFEHKLSDLTLYFLLVFFPSKVILWGHGQSTTTEDSNMTIGIRAFLARRARLYLSYTDSGAEYLQEHGVSPNRIRVLVNSLDTAKFFSESSRLKDLDFVDFEMKHQLKGFQVLAYIGALEEYKKIPLLIKTLNILEQENISVKCLLLGTGSLHENLINQSPKNMIFLGNGDVKEKILVSHFAKCLVIPGRVGLVAIDSIFLKKVIITTDWNYHAPEISYLIPNDAIVIAQQDPMEYAKVIKSFLLSDSERRRKEDALERLQSIHSGESMVANFLTALHVLEDAID